MVKETRTGLGGGILVDEMLCAGLDALALDARDHFERHFSRQERISPRAISQNPILLSFLATIGGRKWKELKLTLPSCGPPPAPASDS